MNRRYCAWLLVLLMTFCSGVAPQQKVFAQEEETQEETVSSEEEERQEETVTSEEEITEVPEEEEPVLDVPVEETVDPTPDESIEEAVDPTPDESIEESPSTEESEEPEVLSDEAFEEESAVESEEEELSLPEIEPVITRSETSAPFTSGIQALSAEGVQLKEGNYVRWIDRVDVPQYALDFYAAMEEAVDGDGAEDWLIDPTQAETDGQSYYVPVRSAHISASQEAFNELFNETAPYILAAYEAFDRDHPEVFWLSGASNISAGASISSGGWDVEIYFILSSSADGNRFDVRDASYQMEDLIYSDIARRDQQVSTILAGATGTDHEIVRYFNSWLTSHNTYNTLVSAGQEGPFSAHRSLSALLGNTGAEGPVCEGYARAMKVLCDQAGIGCVLVDGYARSSEAHSGEAHMWNYVRVGRHWYAVDVTWNDPIYGDGLDHDGIEDFLLVGADTVIGGLEFCVSHPVANHVSNNGVAFINGPEIESEAFVSEETIALEDCIISLDPETCVYDSEEQKPAVTVQYQQETLTQGLDYTLAYANNVNAGDAQVTVTGIGTCTGSQTVSFTIQKAEQTTFTANLPETLTVGKTTTLLVENGIGEISWNSSNLQVATIDDQGTVLAVATGTTTITVQAAGDENHEPAMVELPLQVVESTIIDSWSYRDENEGYYLRCELNNDGVLTIDGRVDRWEPDDMESMLGESPWQGDGRIKKVIISEGIVELMPSAFEGCYNLTEVSLQNGIKYIERRAFYGCSSLEYIDLPESLVNIGEETFTDCSKLKSITIPDQVQGLETSLFAGCSSLESIEFPDRFYYISWYAFRNCESLKSISIPEGVLKIGYGAFAYCEQLTRVELPDSLQMIGEYAFQGCEALTEIVLPDALLEIGECAFTGCWSLSSIEIPSKIIEIGLGTFASCQSLSSVKIPKRVVCIGESAFNQCFALQEVFYTGTEQEWSQILIDDGNDPLLSASKQYEVSADEEDPPHGPENIIWTIDSEGTLNISGTGEMDLSEGSPWKDNTQIKNVIIDPGITEIGAFAFEGCTNLSSITIPEGLTYIGRYAFLRCSNLTQVSLPTGIKSIQEGTFSDCTGLQELILPEGVSSIGKYAFLNCFDLQEIIMPENLTIINDRAFQNCCSLVTVSLPENMFSIGEAAFQGCDRLASITISQGIVEIKGNVFKDCAGLNSVILPDSLEVIEYNAFQNCSSLVEIALPESIREIGEYAFYGCSALQSIMIPEGIESIEQYTFYGCESLQSIVIPEGVRFISEFAFFRCRGLVEVILPESLRSIGSDAFHACSSLQNLVLPEGLERIGEEAFASSGILSITIPGTVKHIGWFAFCGELCEVKIENGVTNIDAHAFEGCNQLERIDIPESVRVIGRYAFSACDNLKSVTLPEGVTIIDEGAFSSCFALRTVELPSTLQEIRDLAFTQDDKLTTITIPDNVNLIGERAFWTCKKLTNIVIPGGVKEIEDSAFSDCTNLSEVVISDGVETIGAFSFFNCGIKQLIIPNSIKSIHSYAFSYNLLLRDIMLPRTMEQISETAFSDCYPENIYYSGTKEEWQNQSSYTFLKEGIRVHYNATDIGVADPISIEDAVIEIIPAVKYSGNPFTPEPRVWVDGVEAIGWVDVEYSYKNNTNAGTATVTITGIGDYCGSVSTTFTISKATNAISQTAKIGRSYFTKSQTIQLAKTAKYEKAKLTYSVSPKNKGIKISASTGKLTIPAKFSGKITVTITSKATANYAAGAKKTVTIYIPTKPTISSVSNSASKTMLVKWKKASLASGYQVQYSTSSKFKSPKTVTVKKQTTVKATIKKLTKGKTYYVRVRSYYTVSSKKFYSAWSATKKVVIKK